MRLGLFTLCCLLVPTTGFADSFGHLYEDYHPPRQIVVEQNRKDKDAPAKKRSPAEESVDARSFTNYDDYRMAVRRSKANPNPQAKPEDAEMPYGWSVNSYAFTERNF